MLKVIELVNYLFRKAADYRPYRLIKQSARYGYGLAHELYRMAKRIVVQIKNRMISRKNPMSVIAFLYDFKSACKACRIHDGEEMWLYKQYRTGPVETAVKSLVAMPKYVNTGHEAALRTYFEVFKLVLRR